MIDTIDCLILIIHTFFLCSHERNAHALIFTTRESGAEESEVDEFGYFKCRFHCGHTYRSKQGRNR